MRTPKPVPIAQCRQVSRHVELGDAPGLLHIRRFLLIRLRSGFEDMLWFEKDLRHATTTQKRLDRVHSELQKLYSYQAETSSACTFWRVCRHSAKWFAIKKVIVPKFFLEKNASNGQVPRLIEIAFIPAKPHLNIWTGDLHRKPDFVGVRTQSRPESHNIVKSLGQIIGK